MTRIGIILGSTGPLGRQVARWAYDNASRRADAIFEMVDLLDYPLPHLGEPLRPEPPDERKGYVQAWTQRIASLEGFVMVTPEYNHSPSGVLKNAIDHLHDEWNNKSVGFVTYGYQGGARAGEHLRLVCGELMMADVRQIVAVTLARGPGGRDMFEPGETAQAQLCTMLDQVVAWSSALSSLRTAPMS